MDTQPKFDELNREFTINDQKIISVTEVLMAAGLVNQDYFTEEGKIRGTAVHQASDLLIRKNLDWDSVHPRCLGFVKAAESFLLTTKAIPILKLCDKRDYHRTLNYVGKPDWFLVLNGKPSLIEIKTGESSTANLQTAAYSELPAFKIYNPTRFLLKLREDGSYRLIKHDNPNDFPLFVKYLFECKK